MQKHRKPEPWQTISTRSVFKGLPWVNVFRDEIRLPSGRVIDDFYRVALPDFVMIYPQIDENLVLFEKKYEHSIGEVCYALPAGTIEPGEEPIVAAKRELLEETGFEAHKWRALGPFFTDSNRGCGRGYFFLASGLKKVSEPIVDDMEEIYLEQANPEIIMEQIRKSNCSTALAALMAMATHPHMSMLFAPI